MRSIRFAALVLAVLASAAPATAVDRSRGVIFDVPDERYEKQFGPRIPSRMTGKDSAAIAAFRFDGDTLRVLAVLVDWSNRPATHSPATIDEMLFSHGILPQGSMADYFAEVSYGQLTVEGDVFGWHDAGTYSPAFDFGSLFAELDPLIDFSQYDGDQDGDVDAVIFVRSGNGEEDSQDPNDIWSFAMSYPPGSGWGPHDGVWIPRWNTSPETRPLRNPADPTQFTGASALNGIRVFAHELTHNLGMPDLYDYDAKLDVTTYTTPGDDNDHPLVDWCLLGYYGYGYLAIGSDVPSHLCGWSKKELGWIDPIVITMPTPISVYDIETHSDSALYLVPIDNTEGEYFLLEYRNPRSPALFDKTDSDFSVYFWPDLTYGSDTLDGGLLITHVHDSLVPGHRINNGTPTYPHYSVAVVDAGYDPARGASYNPEGRVTDSAQWWYPYETRKGATFSHAVSGQSEFSPSSVPNSDGYSGPSGITVRVDSSGGDRLYVTVDFSDELDSDSDGVANYLDNCPFYPNADQADTNGNSIGDACEVVAVTYDTVSTACLKLAVSSSATSGAAGTPLVTMDYGDQGDCEVTYLYQGTPLITRQVGAEYMADYEFGPNSTLDKLLACTPATPTVDMGAYEVYSSGTVLSSDRALGIERVWYAPRQGDSCRFIVQCLKVFSWDGVTHDGLTIGEMLDWDIPSVYPVDNTGGVDAGSRLVYLQGYGMGTCLDNTRRFGGQTLLGVATGGSGVDTAATPYGAYTALNSVYIWPTSGFVPEDIHTRMNVPGYAAEPTPADQHTVMTFLTNQSVGPDDTVFVYTALSTIRDGTVNDLRAEIAKARQWFTVHVLGNTCSCACHGDPQCDGIPDVFDIVWAIDVGFRNQPDLPDPDPACPRTTTDVDCDGDTDVFDVVHFVNVIFRDLDPAIEYCEACGP